MQEILAFFINKLAQYDDYNTHFSIIEFLILNNFVSKLIKKLISSKTNIQS